VFYVVANLEMTLLISALILLLFLIILDKASHLTITNAVKVSEITGLGKATVGFILIAFTTSLPELSVSVFSALTGEMGISIGNVLGSNIVNVCLIVGFAAIFVALKNSESLSMIPSFAKAELESLYFGLFIASVIPLSLLYLAYASRFVGLILIIVFVAYTYQLSRIRIPRNESVAEGERQKLRRYEFWTFAGVMGVLLSSYFIVEYASNIAEIIGVPKSLIRRNHNCLRHQPARILNEHKGYCRGSFRPCFWEHCWELFSKHNFNLGS